MEEQEIFHITKHLDRLVQYTTCNTTLLNILVQNFVLCQEDVQKLTRIHLTEFEQSRLLYTLLESRSNAYSALILALKESKQSGAYTILEELLESQEYLSAKKPKFQKYIAAPDGFEQFIKDKPGKSWAFWKQPTATTALIVCSSDLNITEAKINETNCNHVVWFNEQESIQNVTLQFQNQNTEKITCHKTSNVASFLQLNESTTGRIVIVASDSRSVVNAVLERFKKWKSSTKIVDDDIKWNDLSPQFAEEILDRIVVFQNTPMQLKNIFRFFENCESLLDQKKQLNGPLLVALINDKRPHFLKSTIPALLKYYVPRKILSRATISSALFKKDIADIFVFTGIERHILASFVGPNQGGNRRTDTSRNQMREKLLTVRFIQLLLKNDFEEICKKTPTPVHWLHYKEATFTWVKSRGKMGNLNELVDTTNPMNLKEEEFLAHIYSNDPVDKTVMPICLADTPGMGKTVLLHNIGRKMQSTHVDRVVLFVIFSEFTTVIRSMHESGQLSLDQILLNTLAKYVSDYDLGSFLFTSGVKSGSLKVELLLDGYDEINHQDLDFAKSCLQLITKNFKSVRIIASTRPHLMLDLENTLETVGFNIRAFSKADQIQFLTKFWHQYKLLDVIRLEKFANHCLSVLNNSLTDKDKEIAGIPLLCLLVAQVYEDNAVSYSDPENIVDINVAPDEVNITCITDLFEQAVRKKLQNYKLRYKMNEIDTKKLILAHIRESLRLILPAQTSIWMQIMDFGNCISKAILLKIGLVEASQADEIPRFIHRTFAEYFLSVFTTTYLLQRKARNSLIPNILFHGILATCRVDVENYNNPSLKFLHIFASTFTHQMTTYFINSRLSAIIQDNFDDVRENEMSSSDRSDLALACANDDCPHLLRFLLQSRVYESHHYSFMNENFLIITALCSSVPVFDVLKENVPDYEKVIKDPLSILDAAVCRGDFTVLEYLCYNKKFCETVKRSHKDMQHSLLHSCVKETINEEHGVINQKLQIMRLLVATNRNILTQKDIMGGTAIFCDQIHLRLLKELVKNGSNIMETLEGQTVLHHHSLHLTAEDFYQFLLCIPESNLRIIIKMQDMQGRTPLHCLLLYQEPLKATLDLFARLGVNLTDLSLLEQAFVKGRSAQCIQLLMERCVEWKLLRGINETTPLHIACAYGSLEVVHLLLSLGQNVNIVDKNENTPLHYAVQNTGGSHLEIVQLLLNTGADMMMVNKLQQNALHTSVGYAEVETIQLLIEKQLLEINAKDKKGNTALHLSIMRFSKESDNDVVRLLLDYGADVNEKNENNATPLWIMLKALGRCTSMVTLSMMVSKGGLSSQQIAAAALAYCVGEKEGLDDESYKQLATECLHKGADLNQQDARGRSLLHIAAMKTCRRGVEWLLETLEKIQNKIFSINTPDNDGNTPLHHVMERRNSTRKNTWETAKYLVDMGASILQLNNKGKTPLDTLLTTFHSNAREIDTRLLNLLDCSSEQATCILGLLITQLVGGIQKKFHTDLPSALLARGADLQHKNSDGLTFLHIATIEGCMESVMFLVDHGVNVDVRDNEGNTPCHTAMKNRHTNEVDHLRYLKSRGADMMSLNDAGESLLHSATMFGKVAAIQFLLSLNCDVNAKTKLESTPLHTAFSQLWSPQKYRVIRLLIEAGGNVNAVNGEGNSVADLATQAFQVVTQKEKIEKRKYPVTHIVDGIKMLIDGGLDLGRKNKNGTTILHLLPTFVTASQFHEVVQHLITNGKVNSLSLLDSSSATAIDAACKHFKILNETLDMIKSSGVFIGELLEHA